MEHSIVEYLSEHDGYRCGYCGSPDSNFSHGMWAHTLTCQDYLDLIDRGWRRSGKYVYKPTMDKMCCPLYTIRCHAMSTKLSKSQKKVLKKASKFFATGERGREGRGEKGGEGGPGSQESEEGGSYQEPPAPRKLPEMSAEDVGRVQVGDLSAPAGSNIKGEAVMDGVDGLAPADLGQVPVEGVSESSSRSQKKAPKPGLGADPTKPPCKKAKVRRLEKRQEKLTKRQEKLDDTKADSATASDAGMSHASGGGGGTGKSLEELIVETPPGGAAKHHLEIKLVRSSPMSDEFRDTFEESYGVYKKYQMAIHNDPETKCTSKQYKRFLVDSPLAEQYSDDGPECGYGSFHQHYLLDGRIIAVGVIDILPTCVSSVYFYYDPDYRFLTLGTYSALREIAFTRLLHVTAPSIVYYYMGYYVHSCRKMRYKGQYHPSYLLCPVAYDWHPIEECRAKLDVCRYSRFAHPDKTDPPISIESVLILHRHLPMTYSVYRRYRPNADDEAEMKEYAQLAGSKCIRSLLLYRN